MAGSQDQVHPVISPVYGPVDSWRFGRSLGIDPVGAVSTCSFNCIYCQLGEIQVVTAERREFVPTGRLVEDLKKVNWSDVDVVTLSGSGEPTLATNVGEWIGHIKDTYAPPVHILTNATLFHLPGVREAVRRADVVACKIDAATEETFRKINRPAPGVTLESVMTGIEKLREEHPGRIEVQMMFMPINRSEALAMAKLLRRIRPAEVQLNTPRRAYPLEWHVETRGDHRTTPFEWPTRRLATVSPEQAAEIEAVLREESGVPVHSIYRN